MRLSNSIRNIVSHHQPTNLQPWTFFFFFSGGFSYRGRKDRTTKVQGQWLDLWIPMGFVESYKLCYYYMLHTRFFLQIFFYPSVELVVCFYMPFILVLFLKSYEWDVVGQIEQNKRFVYTDISVMNLVKMMLLQACTMVTVVIWFDFFPLWLKLFDSWALQNGRSWWVLARKRWYLSVSIDFTSVSSAF